MAHSMEPATTHVDVPDEPLPAWHGGFLALVRRLAPLLLGAVLWAVHLGAIYVTDSLLRRDGRRRAADVTVIVLTVVTAVPTAWLAFAGWRGRREQEAADADAADAEQGLAAFAGVWGALLNLLLAFGIVLEGTTVLFLP